MFRGNETTFLPEYIRKDTKFYRNCRHKRKHNVKACEGCPFRNFMEEVDRAEGPTAYGEIDK